VYTFLRDLRSTFRVNYTYSLGRKCNNYIKLTKDRENGEVEFEYEQGKSGEDVKGVGGEGRR
jgi:hypothetical protein